MKKLEEELLYEVVNPMYEVVVDEKANFTADDVYNLQKILENYISTLENIKEEDKDDSIMAATKDAVEKINKLNEQLIREGFIMKEDQDNLIVFFNDVASKFNLSYNEDDITKQYRTW